LRPAAYRVEGGAVVVIAGDRDHLGAGTPQRGERTGDDPGRLRGGGGVLVQVAGDDHQVGSLRLRHFDDLREDRLLLLDARLAVEHLADVPVRGVQDLHAFTPAMGACGFVRAGWPAVDV